jgi:hypothetical protein
MTCSGEGPPAGEDGVAKMVVDEEVSLDGVLT